MRQEFAIYALTAQGAELAEKIASLTGGSVFLPANLRAANGGAPGAAPPRPCAFFSRLGDALAENFFLFSCHALICASGIAVRALAPLLRGKHLDPAVLLLDQRGQFVISLLAGHLGGANDFARDLAQRLGATPVITTGTDVAGTPAIDELACSAGLCMHSLAAARAVNAALLRGEKPWVFDPENLLGLAGSELAEFFELAGDLDAALRAGAAGGTAVLAGAVPGEPAAAAGAASPGVLCLSRKQLWLGLGCRRGVTAGALRGFILRELAEAGVAARDLAGLASVDLKRDEAGLLELADWLELPLRFFSAPELDAVAVPGPSDYVKNATGTASVCEAAALLAAGCASPPGQAPRLLLGKRKGAGMTLALASAVTDG